MWEEELNEIIFHAVPNAWKNRRTSKAGTLKKGPTGIPKRRLDACKIWNRFIKWKHLLITVNTGQITTLLDIVEPTRDEDPP